jgi:hypothetical protein
MCILVSCSNKNSYDAPAPAAATLNLPAQNSICITGIPLSDTENTVTFTWTTSDNTDYYEVVLKNLLTGESTSKSSNTNQLDAQLKRNTPYSWYVVSKSNGNSSTAKSDIWKFYNSGDGQKSHSPFAAEITSPTYGEIVAAVSGSVNLTWTASDVDNDIKEYEIYFGTSSAPPLITTISAKTLNTTVTSGNTYYWKVVTKDSKGNTSESILFQFKVK